MKNFARTLTATALFAAVALTACTAPTAGSTPSSSNGSGSTSSPAAAPETSTPSGAFGGFATAAEACKAIAEQATGASLLPMSAAQGKTAELEQKKAELSETAQRVPDSIKADFARLNEVAVAGLSDQTVYSSGKFQEAIAPVNQWLATNCA
ncbi:hypothetical protein [Arthrobacter pascens]|uniref:hypothetical protein n=1 Tax=Arthrobacter pascens TaxID=1677 RepID=UPI00196B0DD0|nr:hypothetical protein [Arthrobacter pascens]MBN3498635.1 hypothetical protein [Arthrobacter pascens]MDR6557963.1 hypothetical protein [Arthrobacter pascens]